MIISLINHSEVKEEKVLETIRAINRQIAEDFEPYWSMGATLRLEGRSQKRPTRNKIVDMRGDAVIYLWDDVRDLDKALGLHDTNNRGIPYGFVFRALSEQLGEEWTVTLSHEVLELIGDPEANLLVAGPHPDHPRKQVFHWFEMCDAVQDESYEIDGIDVSNFLLPLYFTLSNEKGSRNDFLSTRTDDSTLKSFGTNPGGYIGFFNPATGKHQTHDHDRRAVKRRRIKMRAGRARRALRYKAPHVLKKG